MNVPLTSEPTRSNVVYSLAEYVSQPLMMFVAAPLLLHALGTTIYGIWMLANSIAATVSGLGGGFGDAATRYVSHYHGKSDSEGTVRALVAALIVNCCLGLLLAGTMAVSAPLIIDHIFRISLALRAQAIEAVRVSALLLLLRFCEIVFSSAIRALQRYRPSVTVSVLARATTIVVAVYLARRGMGLTAILGSTATVGAVSLLAHIVIVTRFLNFRQLCLARIYGEFRNVAHYGAFTWLKSVVGVSFSHADRLLIAGMLGVTPLSDYVLCTQLTQPVHSLLAAGFNFLFPAISARAAAGNAAGAHRLYRTAALTAVGAIAGLSLGLSLFGHSLLVWWIGPQEAHQTYGVFIAMIAANGLLAASIVPHYAALALGRVRALATLNLLSGAASLSIAVPLLRHFGVMGGAWMKCVAACISLFAFYVAREAFPAIDVVPHHPTHSRILLVK